MSPLVRSIIEDNVAVFMAGSDERYDTEVAFIAIAELLNKLMDAEGVPAQRAALYDIATACIIYIEESYV